MIPPTELQAARDTLQRAIFSGVRRVQFTDRSVEYNSVDDMRKALADLDAQLLELEQSFAAGDLYADPAAVTALQVELDRVRVESERALEDWERASTALENDE